MVTVPELATLAADAATARRVAAAVPDPELPMVTLDDLGILRDVSVAGDRVVVTITPTYSGCPAMAEIARDLVHHLGRAGFSDPVIRTQLAPPWSSDWITAEGRRKLAEACIAPPAAAGHRKPGTPVPLRLGPPVRTVACPLCGSVDTVQTAAFGATACKALYRCRSCDEPFEYVKEI